MTVNAHIFVHGVVQGVGFRPFVYRTATALDLKGYVQNRGDSLVEIVLEGQEDQVHKFLDVLQHSPPPQSRIDSVEARYSQPTCRFRDFTIYESSPTKSHRGSVIPADIAICDPCTAELMDRKDRRYHYFFITCTDCGPRFTIIKESPYDKVTTSMDEFPMCPDCAHEYSDPADRRFHAQTVACPRCGPKAFLTDSHGETLNQESPIQTAGKLLSEGRVVAVKGYGGYHIATSTLNPDPITKIRRVKHRSQKPFAIMARGLNAVKTFAEVDLVEEAHLTSPQRPILLLHKSDEYYLSDLVSPGLTTVGVMIPYTGLHLMLFENVHDPAFVMTSANPPSEPIIKDDDHALKELKDVVDYFLIHTRKIIHRCDDSVLKVLGSQTAFIRRSRGFTPVPVKLATSFPKAILGAGSELNNTCCLLMDDKAFLSQHIGDVETPETLDFLRLSIGHMTDLTSSQIEAVSCDLHPTFNTTRLAERISQSLHAPLFKIQHHYAHASKLLAEHNLDELIAVVCDGFGYGLDGKAWGGEILHCTKKEFERVGRLEEQSLIGGDLATRYPLRIAAGALAGDRRFEEWLYGRAVLFPHGDEEVHHILHDAQRGHGVKTSSCGRLLDAVAALLEVCDERTYEGEPAIKLEAAAEKGHEALYLPVKVENGNVIETSSLIRSVFEAKNTMRPHDLAHSAQSYVARALAQVAVEEAQHRGVKDIGFTGGVAYNGHIMRLLAASVEEAGLTFRVQKHVPCGDGGISLGQAYAAAHLL